MDATMTIANKRPPIEDTTIRVPKRQKTSCGFRHALPSSLIKMDWHQLEIFPNGPVTGRGTLYIEHVCDQVINFNYVLVLLQPFGKIRLELLTNRFRPKDKDFECCTACYVNGCEYRIPCTYLVSELDCPRPQPDPTSRTTVHSIMMHRVEMDHEGKERLDNQCTFSRQHTKFLLEIERLAPQYTSAIADTLLPMLSHNKSLVNYIRHYIFDADDMHKGEIERLRRQLTFG